MCAAMIRPIFFAVLLLVGHCADHETFKDCARVEFCSQLRTQPQENRYTANRNSTVYSPEESQLQIQLETNNGSKNLNLIVTILVNRTIRLQIAEEGSTRYQLQDVLDGEPQRVEQIDSHNLGENYEALVVGDYSVNINYSPFTVEFWSPTGELQVVLDGSRLNFDQDLDQVFTLGVKFPKAYQLYGIHEHADNLALQTTRPDGTDPYRLRNLDVSGFELNSPMSLYGAIPVLYAQGPESTTGIFLHNAAQQWIEITNGQNNTQSYFMVESGALDLFVFLGPSPTDVVRQYVTLTGTAHLPQLWALGYHQCRWNYMSQDELKDIVANFTTYNFPLDVIWLDIEYSDGKKYFTWNPETFSDPLEMQQNISALHKRLVTIIDPHIKVEQGYNVYDGALEKELFVKNSNGSNFEGICWPGLSSYMDFLNPEARDYYGSYYSYENFPNTTSVLAGIWNDMNEPSVFDDSLEKTLPGDALHNGGVVHRDIHNIYGFLQTKSTHQGLIDRDNGTKRPFILTRSHFAGTQRYSAIWTGDNTADWGYLSVGNAECLNANLLGIVFCGADVGGFAGNPSVELLERWYQAGVWLPFYRAHSAYDTERREPFLFDSDVQQVIRNAIELRYKHLPVWYTLFYEHTRNKDPIVRPLFYHYPSDVNLYNINDHLLVGRDILVRVVAEPGVSSVPVYFPGGEEENWLSIRDYLVYPGDGFRDIDVDIQGLPVYYRRGSIIVRKDTVRLSSDEMSDDGHTLYAILDINEKATSNVYLDDNFSFNYINNKEYNYLRIDVEDTNVTLTKIDDDANSDDFDFSIDLIYIHIVTQQPLNGKPGQYESKAYRTDANGQLLKNLKLKFEKSTTIQLA